jgi:endoglucanase
MKTILAVTLLLIMAVSIMNPAYSNEPQEGPHMSFIGVDGNRFVDEDGNTVIFRGVSFSDPDKLEKEGQWNRRYFQAAKDWNCNVVRFPVHPRAWRERGQEAYLALLDQGIQWAGELGMYVIIDWHSIGNLYTELFQHPMYNTSRTETYRFWKAIAERYVDNPVVAFYEVFNEPTHYHGTLGRMSWEQYKEIIEEIVYIIYAHDTGVIPLVGGFDWAYELTHIKESPIDFPGIAYVSHPYPQKREQPWEEKWEADFGFAADTYPLFVTEFGFMSEDGPGAHIPVIGDETYGEAIIDYFNRKGISWTAWVFDPVWSPQLINNWDFDPAPQGQFFMEKLRELNK